MHSISFKNALVFILFLGLNIYTTLKLHAALNVFISATDWATAF